MFSHPTGQHGPNRDRRGVTDGAGVPRDLACKSEISSPRFCPALAHVGSSRWEAQADVAGGPPTLRGGGCRKADPYVAVPSQWTGAQCARSAVSRMNWRRWRRGWSLAPVEVVAMEATGVYWIPVYEVLDPGASGGCAGDETSQRAKSDVRDCQWIRELMSYLRGAFRPRDEDCAPMFVNAVVWSATGRDACSTCKKRRR